ncbi:hypothetical protein, partial [Sphingomonas sanguinis]|uniref:hypothetical protein n=1 Tax=Sphingomonas sanguinis TaxID=33051 RepID=UPI003019AF43
APSAHPSASTGRSSTLSSRSLNQIAPPTSMGPDPKKIIPAKIKGQNFKIPISDSSLEKVLGNSVSHSYSFFNGEAKKIIAEQAAVGGDFRPFG